MNVEGEKRKKGGREKADSRKKWNAEVGAEKWKWTGRERVVCEEGGRHAGHRGRQAGHTHLLAPGLVVRIQEEQAGSGHGAQDLPHLRSGQQLQGLS